MKLRLGQPKYGVVWGFFALLAAVFFWFGYSQLALLATAGYMAAYLIGMIAERREYEAKGREAKSLAEESKTNH